MHDGFLANSAAKPVEVKLNDVAVAQAVASLKANVPSKNSLEVVFHRDYSLDDGRYNNNGWLQELPDPVTKITWDNAVLISRKTAEDRKLIQEALIKCNLAIEKEPDFAPAYLTRATVFALLDSEKERAKDDILTTLRLKPDMKQFISEEFGW